MLDRSIIVRSFFYSLLLTFVMIKGDTLSLGESRPLIAIQPFGQFDNDYLETVKEEIGGLYNVDIVVLPSIDLPGSAYYEPRGRYRAEKILDHLETISDPRYDKILGLTDCDISTTKGDYYDWGIFGLGTLSGRACVVSTYRLNMDKVPQEKFLGRLVKVVNHELGHVFGLDHCPIKGCLMEDARGKISTVDGETGGLCDACRKKLGNLVISE